MEGLLAWMLYGGVGVGKGNMCEDVIEDDAPLSWFWRWNAEWDDGCGREMAEGMDEGTTDEMGGSDLFASADGGRGPMLDPGLAADWGLA